MANYLSRTLIFSVFICISVVSAQKPPGKFGHAVERSRDAARIIAAMSLVEESGFPAELLAKAKAVGVFPNVKSEASLFTSMTQGYGVISAHTPDGWTMPAYYSFGGGGYTKTFFEKNDKHAVVLLFMSDDAMGWFEKGGVDLTNEKKALPGPVGKLTDEQRKEIEGAQILAYIYFNGRLDGTAFGKSFWKRFGLNPDNNINTPMYGIKGREVLAGKPIPSVTVPPGISAYQESLTKYSSGNN